MIMGDLMGSALKEYFFAKIVEILFISIAILLVISGSCQYMNYKAGLENDNEIEQQIENIIEFQTGLKVDLTPD